MNMNQEQFVAYYRVSSKRQREEGVSISAQKKLIHEYALRNNFKIIKEVAIDESAKKEGRKAFSELLKLVKENPAIRGIIGEKVDRVLRGNLKDRVALEDLMNFRDKEFHFIKESLILNKDSKSFQKLHFDIQNGFARFFLNNLSDEVRKAYDILVEDGFYPHIPPHGYKEKLDEHLAIIDPNVSPFIKRVFELCATEEYSEKQISEILYKDGFRSRKGNKVGKSAISKILHNTFYFGHFKWKGKIYKGSYEPIISKDLFDKVQEVLHPNKKRSYKHDFAYTGIMRCGECGNGITAEVQKGHIYYHCTKPKGAKSCSQRFVREETIEEQLEKVIKAVALDLKKVNTIKDIMRLSLADEQLYLKESLDALNTQYNDLQEQITKLLELHLKGKVKEELYNTQSKKLENEVEDINTEIAKFKHANRAYLSEMEAFLSFCNEAPKLFKSSRPALKRELLRFVVSNLILKDKKVEFSLRTPFNIIAKYSKNENWQGCTDSNREKQFWRLL